MYKVNIFRMMILILVISFASCDEEMEQDYNRDYDNVSGADSVRKGQQVPMKDELQEFIIEAASDGIMEIQLGEMAFQKTNNYQVKDLAQMIKNDHQEANNQLMEIARNNNFIVPDNMIPKHQQLVQQFQNLSGQQFNTEYVQFMVNNHEEAIRKFQAAADITSKPNELENPATTSMYYEDDNISNVEREVKQWINNTIPVLEKHLAQARELLNNLNKK